MPHAVAGGDESFAVLGSTADGAVTVPDRRGGDGVIEHPAGLLTIADEGPISRWWPGLDTAVLAVGLALQAEQALDLGFQPGAEVTGGLANGRLQQPGFALISRQTASAISMPPNSFSRRSSRLTQASEMIGVVLETTIMEA